jgi:hypothetical protein
MTKINITFSDFWHSYNLKRDRLRAERAWNRLSDKDRRDACNGIEAYQSACRITGKHISYAQGYLNNRLWLCKVQGSSYTASKPDMLIW